MNRLRWVFLTIVFCAFVLSILLGYLPASEELGGRFGSQHPYGDAAYVAFVVGAALWPRGIVWLLGIGVGAFGAVVFLLGAISQPGDTIRWLFAGVYAIEALALFGLGTADRHSRESRSAASSSAFRASTGRSADDISSAEEGSTRP
jgi:hypothetical protein